MLFGFMDFYEVYEGIYHELFIVEFYWALKGFRSDLCFEKHVRRIV